MAAPAGDGEMKPVALDRRLRLLAGLFLVWLAIITLRLGQLMLLSGDSLLSAMTRESWFEGEIPGPRGNILDHKGLPLAWSTRHFSLVWQALPGNPPQSREELAIFSQALGADVGARVEERERNAGKEIILIQDLTPRQMLTVNRLLTDYPALQVRSYTVRHRSADPALRALLGEVTVIDGCEVGISGKEKDHDLLLRGRPGRFRVLLDRQGHWLKETWRKTVDIGPGYDVYLPINVGSKPAP